MPYALKIVVEGDVLSVAATGNRTPQTIMAIARDILAACVENDRKKVLIDVSALEGRLAILEAYDIPAKEFPKLRNPSVITHCAIIDLMEFEDRYRFFEDVAVNRGFKLRIFSNKEKALAWLKE